MLAYPKHWSKLYPEEKAELARRTVDSFCDKRTARQCSTSDPGPMPLDQMMCLIRNFGEPEEYKVKSTAMVLADSIEAAMRIEPLWCPPKDSKPPEDEPEKSEEAALHSMAKAFRAALLKYAVSEAWPFQELAPLVFEEVYRDHPGVVRDCTTCFGRYVAFRDSWCFTRPGYNRPEIELPATSIEHAEQLCWEHHQNRVRTNLFVQRPT